MLTAAHVPPAADIVSQDAPAASPAIVRYCPNCGDTFEPPVKGPGQHKRFCKDGCRTAWANREKAQGAVLITVAKIWRETRGSGEVGKAAFAEMTSILDLLIGDDRKDGRRSLKSKELEPFVRGLLRDPYLDRRR